MEGSVRNQYLSTAVMTATPQKLQLLLVEAAIRSCEKARNHWSRNDREAACEALVHAQECVAELLGALNRDGPASLVGKMASVYLFVFNRLVGANNSNDEAMLDDALKVLQMERDTWRQVCEQVGVTEDAAECPAHQIGDRPAPAAPVDLTAGAAPLDARTTTVGFSLEA